MNEVFFQGYGRWIGYKSPFPESYFEPGPNYIQQSYTFHTGIFKLPEDSEKAYKHTQKIVTSVLHPNIGHEERARFPCEDIFNCDDPDNVKSPTIETFFKMAMFGTLWFEIDKTQKFILIPANANITNINDPNDEELISDTLKNSAIQQKERELTAWLRETWIKEKRPGGKAFFGLLKKYENANGSPIINHYSAGKNAGFLWKTSTGRTGSMSKKTVQTKVSIFKNNP